MGRLWVNVAALALEAPLDEGWSGALAVWTFGIELVVVCLGNPGWNAAPPALPKLPVPFRFGDLALLMVLTTCARGEISCDRTSPPPIGISPDVGVRVMSPEDSPVGESLPLRRSCVPGDN
jgi:hypothetical protein